MGLFRNKLLELQAQAIISKHRYTTNVAVYAYRANEDGSVSKILIGKYIDKDCAAKAAKRAIQTDSTLIGWSW